MCVCGRWGGGGGGLQMFSFVSEMGNRTAKPPLLQTRTILSTSVGGNDIVSVQVTDVVT